MTNSKEFYEIIGKTFNLEEGFFTNKLEFKAVIKDIPDVKCWEVKVLTDMFDLVYYEINHSASFLNLRVKNHKKLIFDDLWNNLKARILNDFPDIVIKEGSDTMLKEDNKNSCIHNNNKYLLVKQETLEYTLLSVTIDEPNKY